jgi:hypothetical protein
MINMDLKIDIERMKLREQEVFEELAGCSILEVQKKGLSGKRLAALVYIFVKREQPEVTFEEILELDLSQVSNMMDIDSKKAR